MNYALDKRTENWPATDFAATLSHQILGCSTDLQAIAQVLGETQAVAAPVPRELTNYLYRVIKELRRLGHETLSLSQTLDSEELFTLAPLDVGAVVGELARSFEAPDFENQLETRCLARNPWVWWSEPEQLRMVLDSLINPLLCYARPGSRLIITLEEHQGQLERENGYLLVSLVSPESVIQPGHSAELFANPTRDLSMEQLNSGLSLYLSRQLIERHGGQLEIENGAGGSLTLWFTLPLVHSSVERQ
jgi:signal transduction histidine kinase